ncbi:PASTA domain-containing protein [Coprobacillaceae bacterium CR2/5/TPMF4]|nr:PASTA domain-containing protein [Coprobacillaceae bacterium CR2/5/TPMF4]
MIPLWAKITTGATTATLVTLCILIAFGVIDLSSILGNGSSKTLKENETYIPGILNMSLADAQEEAEDAEVVLQITDKVQSEKVDANKVMSQDPKPGLIMIKDGLVNVVVSKGETQAVVPDVTYMKEEMAKQLVENAGFKVKIKNADLKGVAPGTVGKQNIEGNTIYDIGSTITLTVSNNKSIKGNGKVGSYVNKNFLAQYQVPISKVYTLLLLKENMMIKLKKVILFLKVQKKGLN